MGATMMANLSTYTLIKCRLLIVNKKSPLDHRFWAAIDKDGPIIARMRTRCWIWTGCRSKAGYGVIYSNSIGGLRYAHRLSWEIFNTKHLEDEICVLHKCDNPSCVNPSHLFIGTDTDNKSDMVYKGRQNKGEKQWKAKLSCEDVLSVRKEYKVSANKRWSNGHQLAVKYGVTVRHIKKIVSGKSWKHI